MRRAARGGGGVVRKGKFDEQRFISAVLAGAKGNEVQITDEKIKAFAERECEKIKAMPGKERQKYLKDKWLRDHYFKMYWEKPIIVRRPLTLEYWAKCQLWAWERIEMPDGPPDGPPYAKLPSCVTPEEIVAIKAAMCARREEVERLPASKGNAWLLATIERWLKDMDERRFPSETIDPLEMEKLSPRAKALFAPLRARAEAAFAEYERRKAEKLKSIMNDEEAWKAECARHERLSES